MSIRIVFTRSSGSLAVYGEDGRRIMQATARMVKEPIFPAFLNRDYLFQSTDQSRSVCHFQGWDNIRNVTTSNNDDIIQLTYAAGLVTPSEGGILVTDGSVATWRGLIDSLACHSAFLSIINLEVMKPSPIFSTSVNSF